VLPALIVLFIAVPIIELAVIIQVGQLIGLWPTLAILVADSILGSVLMRSQGRAAWRGFNAALASGRPPAREVLDGVLVIFGGALLLTPGFATDIFGLLLLFPPTRAVARRLLVRRFAGRMVASATAGVFGRGRPPRGPGGRAARAGTTSRARPPRSTPSPGGFHDDHRRPRGPAGPWRGSDRRGHVRVRRPDHRAVRPGPRRPGPGDPPQRSGMGVLFEGGEPVAVRAEGASDDAAPAGVSTEIVEPLRRWRVRFADVFDLDVEALTPPAALDARDPAAKAGGMEGYEQLCRLRGTVRGREVDCLGSAAPWGAPDGRRSPGADGQRLARHGDRGHRHRVRPANASTTPTRRSPRTSSEGGVPVAGDRAAAQHDLRRRGPPAPRRLELWSATATTAARTARPARWLCGTTLDLGRPALDAAFFAGNGRAAPARPLRRLRRAA
jgi:UPF0716 protein FxsA